jgi:hypothetical protein
VRQLLPPGAQSQRGIAGQIELHIQKRLMQVKLVFVGGPRSASAAVFQAALELTEEANVLAHVKIAMQKVSLQEIAMVLRVLAPVGIIEVFVTFPRFPAYREIPGACFIERDILEGVPQVCAPCGIAQVEVILVGAVELVGRRRSCFGAGLLQRNRHHGNDKAD